MPLFTLLELQKCKVSRPPQERHVTCETHRKKDETIRLGAVLTVIPDKVTVTVQLHVDVLEPLRQKSLCDKMCQTKLDIITE